MLNNSAKPSFGVKQATITTDNKRQESGAIWKRQSKKDNSEFLSIKINFSKEKLKLLLDKEGDSVDIGFVAFSNPFKSEGIKRPDFRVFEDRENGE
jgi:uncharacterized protein (DUF736 family)